MFTLKKSTIGTDWGTVTDLRISLASMKIIKKFLASTCSQLGVTWRNETLKAPRMWTSTVGNWERMSPLQSTGLLGQRREHTPAGPGAEPDRIRVWFIFCSRQKADGSNAFCDLTFKCNFTAKTKIKYDFIIISSIPIFVLSEIGRFPWSAMSLKFLNAWLCVLQNVCLHLRNFATNFSLSSVLVPKENLNN